MAGISLSEILHNRPFIVSTIYGYILPDLADHNGYIKVGYTEREDTEQRIKEQLHTAGISNYKIVFKSSAMRSDGTSFTDKDVHRILRRKRIKQFNEGIDRNEWFNCTVEDIKDAVNELITGIRLEGQRTWTFSMREEQTYAVDMTAKYFRKALSEDPNRPPKFLWNAKMRFGKTFATYQLAKEMGFKKILILTFKPAVESAWQEDISHHIDFDGWQFVSNKEAKFDAKKLDEQFETCDKSRPIVVFGSFQDMLGTNEAGGIKAKNEFIHTTNWDLVAFDEYHFGAWRENAKNLFEKFDEEDNDFDIEKYQREEAGNAINETFLPITAGHYLYLSGTPFRALNSGEFLEDQVFNWTYSDEQFAKENWKGNGDNPYAALPKMIMLTYKVPDEIVHNAVMEGFDEFDINEFFKAEPQVKGKPETARFIYESDVQKWLELIRGRFTTTDDLKLGSEKPPMPFSDTTLLNVLTHTLWYLPNVASCYAMANLLAQKQNSVTYGSYKVIVCAGAKAGIGLDALYPVQHAMGDPLKTKTITLTCGKLTTGVTVRPWTGIFMLRNLKSPESYFQAAFRVQSPWETIDDCGNRVIIKKECYIFDFALERALHQIADYSCRLKVDDISPESKVSEFIQFLPVLAFDGASMNQIDAQDILDITYAGTSATLLAKRWQTALLVHVDNDTLKKLRDNPDAMAALMNIEGFRALNAEIDTIINRSEKVKKLKKEKGDDITDKEKKEMSEADKEAKSLRKQVQEKLLKLAARIPAFMYLTDFREYTIKDVITQIEPELFKKVTGLNVKDFEILNEIGLFDPEKMNQGIFGFRKYENSSLSYTGIDMHECEDVGGWDTVLRREEYEALYARQQASMEAPDFVDIIVPKVESIQVKREIINKPHQIVEEKKDEGPDWEKILANVDLGIKVNHKKFGDGKIIWMDSGKKYFRVSFIINGIEVEKQFAFPNAFIDGFLTVSK
ncbi:MAG: GIY-YIG nuclease family protein [Clostridia bacterium]|nr:GIY-YIG nuclease family protein [Clostridia bacterium]